MARAPLVVLGLLGWPRHRHEARNEAWQQCRRHTLREARHGGGGFRHEAGNLLEKQARF